MATNVSMILNTTIVSATCPDQKYWTDVGETATFVVFKVLMPIYVIVGSIGNLLKILVFIRQIKKETGYNYQIVLVICQSLEIFFFAMYGLTIKWFGRSSWYQAYYYLMVYTSYCAVAFHDMAATSTLFITLAMAVDRLFALAKPLAYTNANHSRNLIIVTALCVSLGICLSLCECFRDYPKETNGIYISTGNLDYMQSTTAQFLFTFGDSIRSAATVALVAANISMVYLYSRNLKNAVKVISPDTDEYKKRQAAQKVLILLAFTESTFMFLSMLGLDIFNQFIVTRTDMYGCKMRLISGIVDGTFIICEMLSIGFLFGFSKKYRRMVGDAVPALKICCR